MIQNRLRTNAVSTYATFDTVNKHRYRPRTFPFSRCVSCIFSCGFVCWSPPDPAPWCVSACASSGSPGWRSPFRKGHTSRDALLCGGVQHRLIKIINKNQLNSANSRLTNSQRVTLQRIVSLSMGNTVVQKDIVNNTCTDAQTWTNQCCLPLILQKNNTCSPTCV